MSTAVLPDVLEGEELEQALRDDPDLAKLMDPDRDVPCEILHAWGSRRTQCSKPARWIIYAKFNCCSKITLSRPVCEECLRTHKNGTAPFACSGCNAPVQVKMIDRLK